MKIRNICELQQIAYSYIYHSLDIEYKDVLEKDDDCAKYRYSFVVFDTTLSCDRHLQVRKKSNKRRKKT